MKTMNTQQTNVKSALIIFLFLVQALVSGQSNTDIAAISSGSIPYATQHVISNDDSAAVIVEKAAKVLPRPNQTAWMRLEWIFFLHYGPNTFNGVEWGSGREEPSEFNPSSFDADQWVRAMKEAGGKMIVLVCKHHDGLCLWPTCYTSHSVASSPWLGGKGDVVRAVADAARKYGLKLGVYLSPADLYQLRTNPKNPNGYYGNGSSSVPSVIPTDPACFKTNPSLVRTPPWGFKFYTYEVDDYNRYFLNQLYELLTEYGPIQEIWFDGANPDPSVKETYNYAAWYDLICKLQPGAVIFGKGPDVRWVGTESGYGRTTEWSVIPLPTSPDKFYWPDMQAGDLGSRAKLTPGSHLWWYPTETNVTILANGQWFWAPGKKPRSVSQLVDIYYSSIGRNGNLILNLSPDTRGLVPDNQLEALSQMAQIVKGTFATNLAVGGRLTADTSNPANSPSLALDGNLDTWWEAAPGHTNAAVTLTLPASATFDVVSLQEAVDYRGQRIESFVIEAWNGTAWITAEHIASDKLTTIGHKRLIRLKSPVTTDKVRIRITGSRLEPTLAEMGLFKQAAPVSLLSISERDTNGFVALSNAGGSKMVYTTDGTVPTTKSTVYSSPIEMPLGGTVQAACLLPNGRLGMVTSKTFAGLVPTAWKVVAVDSQETAAEDNAAACAIDDNSSTIWHSRWYGDLALPHSITIDMGTSHRINGFTYLPRQDGNPNGIVERYRFEMSTDGVTWVTQVASGTFGNIRNNPSLQEVRFTPVNARFFRFTALQEINNNGWTSAAEISVLPAGTEEGRVDTKPVTVTSPNGKLKIEIQTGAAGQLIWSVYRQDQLVLAPAPLGLTVDGNNLGQSATLGEPRKRTINEQYPTWGNHAVAINRCDETVIPVECADGMKYELEVRAFDDGAAVRTHVVLDDTSHTIAGEATSWSLPLDSRAWWARYDGGYEKPCESGTLETIPARTALAPPITFRLGENLYVSLTEANNDSFPDMGLERDGNFLKAVFPASSRGWRQQGSIVTPWRVAIIAEGLNALVNSDIVTNLCPSPSPELASAEWIKPGRSLWHWWSIGAPGLNDQKEWVDAAKNLGFEYYLIDEGWRNWRAPGKDQWECLKNVIDYGKTQGVGCLVWVNSSEMRTANSRRAYLEKVAALGAVGIKIDFIPGCTAGITRWYEGALKDTAELHLLCNFHGAVKPTGRRRTWPHELTREAVRGHEYHMTRYRRIQTAEHDETVLFTRFLAGPADYTPTAFDLREMVGYTWAHLLAQGVNMTSPLQHFAGKYQDFIGNPAEDLLRHLPSTWDETIVLPGSEIGKTVGFARRRGQDWYIGVLNGGEAATMPIELSFLGAGAWQAEVFGDDPDNPAAFKRESKVVKASDKLMVSMSPRGGAVVWITKTR